VKRPFLTRGEEGKEGTTVTKRDMSGGLCCVQLSPLDIAVSKERLKAAISDHHFIPTTKTSSNMEGEKGRPPLAVHSFENENETKSSSGSRPTLYFFSLSK